MTILVLLFALSMIAILPKASIGNTALLVFILYKTFISVGFNGWAVYTDMTYDAFGYYRRGLEHSMMFGNLFRGDAEYLQSTPFFGLDGISSERFTSLVGFLLVVTGNSFLACSLLLGFLGGLGQLLFVEYLVRRFPDADRRYFYIILFHPSLCLWSASMLKDSVGIFALGFGIFCLDDFLNKLRLFPALGILVAAYISLLFRSYILFILGTYIFYLFWDRRVKKSGLLKTGRTTHTVIYLTFAVTCGVLGLLYYVANYGSDLVEAQKSSNDIYAQIDAGSTFDNATFGLSASGLIGLPLALVNTLLRPFLWEVRNASQFLSALENTIVLVFIAHVWRLFLSGAYSHATRGSRGLMYGSTMVCFLSACGIGLFSSNLGTISRYRVPVIPFLLAGPCVFMALRSSGKLRYNASMVSVQGPVHVARV